MRRESAHLCFEAADVSGFSNNAYNVRVAGCDSERASLGFRGPESNGAESFISWGVVNV